MLRCADAVILHQPDGILGSELGAEEQIEIVLLLAVQSLCNSLCADEGCLLSLLGWLGSPC